MIKAERYINFMRMMMSEYKPWPGVLLLRYCVIMRLLLGAVIKDIHFGNHHHCSNNIIIIFIETAGPAQTIPSSKIATPI